MVGLRRGPCRVVALALAALSIFVVSLWASPASAELAWAMPASAPPDDGDRHVEREREGAPEYALASPPPRLETARGPRRAFGAALVPACLPGAPLRLTAQYAHDPIRTSRSFVSAPSRRRSLLMVFLN